MKIPVVAGWVDSQLHCPVWSCFCRDISRSCSPDYRWRRTHRATNPASHRTL